MAPLALAAIKIAASFIPEMIGKVAGPDAQNVAAKVVDIAQAVTGTADPDSALAVLNASPDKVLEFRQAIAAQQADLEKAYLIDTQSARDRDVELAKAGVKNYRANGLAAGAGFLIILCLALAVWQSDMDENAKAIITLVLGRALGWVDQIFGFEFGTNRSSQTKDNTINNLTK